MVRKSVGEPQGPPSVVSIAHRMRACEPSKADDSADRDEASDDFSPPKGQKTFRHLKNRFKEFAGLDEALSWAHHLEESGRDPLMIEGDNGTQMDRRSIIDALRVGARERIRE